MYFQYTKTPTITEAKATNVTAPAETSLIKPILLSNSGCMMSQIFSMAVLKVSALKTPIETVKTNTASIAESFK